MHPTVPSAARASAPYIKVRGRVELHERYPRRHGSPSRVRLHLDKARSQLGSNPNVGRLVRAQPGRGLGAQLVSHMQRQRDEKARRIPLRQVRFHKRRGAAHRDRGPPSLRPLPAEGVGEREVL
eukprot:2861995-Rhodomonas_salina.2